MKSRIHPCFFQHSLSYAPSCFLVSFQSKSLLPRSLHEITNTILASNILADPFLFHAFLSLTFFQVLPSCSILSTSKQTSHSLHTIIQLYIQSLLLLTLSFRSFPLVFFSPPCKFKGTHLVETMSIVRFWHCAEGGVCQEGATQALELCSMTSNFPLECHQCCHEAGVVFQGLSHLSNATMNIRIVDWVFKCHISTY